MTGPAHTAARRAQEAARRIEAWAAADRARRDVAAAGGRVARVEERGAAPCRYEHDAQGELSAIVEPDGRRERYRYDAQGRLTRVERADGSVARYAYGPSDRLSAVEDRGVRSTFEHDAAGRLISARRGGAGAVRFRYDAHGRVVEAATPEVTTEHAYDAAGRTVAIRQSLGGVAVSLSLDYDGAGRLSRMTLPGSDVPVRYRWGERGRLRSVALGDRTLAELEYRPEGAAVETRLADGTAEVLELDPVDGRPAALRVVRGGDLLLERRWEYAATGEVVGDGAWRYRYDPAGSLREAEELATGRRWRFQVDAAGDLVGIDAPDGPRAFPELTRDASGRPIASVSAHEELAYRYDDAGQLLEVLRCGAAVARFLYDHKGRLVRARYPGRGERYLYGPEDELLAVTDEAGRPLRLYVRTPLGALAIVRGPLASPDEIVYLHGDPRGTCHLATSGGEVIGRIEYSPFGLPSPGDALAHFCGRAYCPEVGMYWFGSRWYRPDLGRFLTPDSYTAAPDDERLVHPALPASGQRAARAAALGEWLRRPRLRNRLAFCCNDPLNRVDANGHWSGWVILYAIGALWALPNTLFGLVIEIANITFEAIHFLWWLIAEAAGWDDPWQWIGFDAAASGNLDAFALVFEGGWFSSVGNWYAITFGNVFFTDKGWRKAPQYTGDYELLPEAYGGAVAIKAKDGLYEHELRHTNQYAWLGPFFHLGLPLWGAYIWSVLVSGYDGSWFEVDARRHSEGPTRLTGVRVKLRTQVGAAAPADLAGAWVYWMVGAELTVLRTAPDGSLRRIPAPAAGGTAADPRSWASYTADFEAAPGASPRIFFSRGARLLPETFLRANPAMFQPGSVVAPANYQGDPALAPPAEITLQEAPIQLTAPAELSIWPLLWELPLADYATAGLPQGAALFDAKGNVTQVDHAPARPAVPDASRPRERGLAVRGDVDGRATGATVELIDGNGAPLQLRETRDAAAGVARVAATLGAAAGARKPLTATVFLLDPAAAQGPVFVVVRATGVMSAATPPAAVEAVAAFSCHLCGVQLALVSDAPATLAPGTPPGEADELLVLDFDGSPRAAAQTMRAQARCRRMACYQMGVRDRAPTPADPPTPQPEMPLWMAELQLLGLGKAQLEELLARRKEALPGNPTTLEIAVEARLHLQWDGPDLLAPPDPYRYALDVDATPAATIQPAPDGTVRDVAHTPAPALPVAGRRPARLAVEGAPRRAWGRTAAARALDAVVLEWAPRVSPADEVMRGGDGSLSVRSVRIGGAPIDPGLLTGAGGALAPPAAGASLLELPPFRVRGLNPAYVRARLIDPVVQAYYDAHHADAGDAGHAIGLLGPELWMDLCHRIVGIESRRRQFEANGTRTSGHGGRSYGLQQDMPLFGPPHGYGFGQHDTPRVSHDGAWSFAANIEESVRRIMQDKAGQAYAVVKGHLGMAPARVKAVFRRELVRSYNGGGEFQWNGADWEINPTVAQWMEAGDHAKGPNPNLTYPNAILGTGVVYFNGAGAATTFPWPIAFTAADYGPGI